MLENNKFLSVWGEREKVYFAGLIDGEGTINLSLRRYDSRKIYDILVKISMTDSIIFEKFIKIIPYGDKKIYRVIRKKNPRMKWKDLYVMEYYSSYAYKVLEDIFPFLILKLEQASLAMTLFRIKKALWDFRIKRKNIRGRMPYPKVVTGVGEYLKDRMLILNKRGMDGVV